MAYVFTHTDTSARDGLRRIAHAEGAAAVTGLAAGTPGTIHGTRKRIKKLRALLRLVEPRMDNARAEGRILRDAARHLSGARDAEVRLATFRRVLATLPPDAAAAVAPLATALSSGVAPATDPAVPLGMIAGLRDRIDGWDMRGKGFALIEAGLSHRFDAAAAALLTAKAARAGAFHPEPFHAFRKAAKTHWYHARLLFPIWPEMMAPHCAAADALGELLGDHNDLAVLADSLSAIDGQDAATVTLAVTAAHAQRAILADRALLLGTRLFTGTGEDLACRWGVWWRLWRADLA